MVRDARRPGVEGTLRCFRENESVREFVLCSESQGERLAAALLMYTFEGSFDSVNASLREAFTALRMTGVEVVMKDHEYFVYIVCSRSGTLYIGMTNSIYRRAEEPAVRNGQ